MTLIKNRWVTDSTITAEKVDLTDNFTWTGIHDITSGIMSVPTPNTGEDAANKEFIDGIAGQPVQEVHKVTSDEVTQGYFTLINYAINQQCVGINASSGTIQLNKACVGSSGVTPDFSVTSDTLNRVNINTTGDSGLSNLIVVDDILIVNYFKYNS